MSCRPLFRGPRATPAAPAPHCGRAAAPLVLLLLAAATSPAAAQGEPTDPCPIVREEPGAALPSRALRERARCLEAQGRLEEAVPLLYRLALAPEATVRERAYLALYRLGQEVALPPVGEAGALPAAPGCLRSLWVDRYAWAERRGLGARSGSGALLFSTVPDVEPTPPYEEEEWSQPGAGLPLLRQGSGDERQDEPLAVETGRPEDRVSDTGGALDLLVSARDEAAQEDAVRGEDLACTVIVADACSGRVGVVCEDRGGLPAPSEDVPLPFPLPPERLEVKEFQLP